MSEMSDRGELGMPGLGGAATELINTVRGDKAPDAGAARFAAREARRLRSEAERWMWEPQPGFPGWVRRSCCKAPDTMSHHYQDCFNFEESEVHASPQRSRYSSDGTGHSVLLRVRPETELARRILRYHAAYALEHFLRRNAEYGDDDNFNLGSRGQYVDISRKVQKLKRYMWDGEEVKDGAESIETIVVELIGHLLMTMDYLESENGQGEEGTDQG